MNKVVLIIVVVIALVASALYFGRGEINAPTVDDTILPTPTVSATLPPEAEDNLPLAPSPPSQSDSGSSNQGQNKTWTISMTSNGFEPSELTIKAGDTVKFVNNDTAKHWPASDVHPTHQILPEFDALKGIEPGASYQYTFKKIGEWSMHDHLRSSFRGTITVQ